MLSKISSKFKNLIKRLEFGGEKWKSRFAYFGKEAQIQRPAIIEGYDKISIGDNTVILPNSRIQNYEGRGTDVEGIEIGKGCYIGSYLTVLNAGKIVIGNRVLIASNVLITSENHGMDPESDIDYMDQPLTSKPVEIGDGCWIGQNVCILPGVKIGKKAIIAAGSIVTKDVPEYCIAAGNPARIIKKYDFETHRWERHHG